jgi:hypothetical protein
MLVDLSAQLISDSRYHGSGYGLPGSDDDHTHIKGTGLSPSTKEFWAWQFGRVVALAHSIDYADFLEGGDGEFGEWGNGVVALSLLLGSGRPVDWLGRWTGVVATCDFQSMQDDNDLTVTSHLFWLMHLGVENVTQRSVGQQPIVTTQCSALSPESADVLLLGSSTEIAQQFKEIQDRADKLRLEDAIATVKNYLSESIWDMLPTDAQDHLVDAELAFQKRDRRNASLDYANSVEAALLEWFPAPKGGGWWPRSLGDWTEMRREMTVPNPRGHRFSAFKGRCDIKYASPLLGVLDAVRQARLSRAHPGPRLPATHKVREVVLSTEGTNVFELLLRFAKRWRG